MRTAYIVGAGFSSHAGLPLASGFTSALLEARGYEKGPSRVLVDYLSYFVSRVFGPSQRAKPNSWPDLEDLFTCLDLSCNSGHHLGHEFSPAELRTIRRSLLSRTVRMLDRRYNDGLFGTRTPERVALNRFFETLDPRQSGFISMNWDTVIEAKIGAVLGGFAIDYQCDAIAAQIQRPPDPMAFPRKSEFRAEELKRRQVGMRPERENFVPMSTIPIVKMHGSINWLYCDACRRLFWFDPAEAHAISDQILTGEDAARIVRRLGKEKVERHVAAKDLTQGKKLTCDCGGNVELSTRIATFSYEKALHFPMFQKSWFAAERLLRSAARWVFIGYSLPPADFEFKYMLKRIQLSRPATPEIVVVTGGGAASVAATRSNYEKFFGSAISRDRFVPGGLEEYCRNPPV